MPREQLRRTLVGRKLIWHRDAFGKPIGDRRRVERAHLVSPKDVELIKVTQYPRRSAHILVSRINASSGSKSAVLYANKSAGIHDHVIYYKSIALLLGTGAEFWRNSSPRPLPASPASTCRSPRESGVGRTEA